MAKTPADVMKMAKDAGVQIVDFRFVDLFGTWQHTSKSIRDVDEDIFEDGVGFDGSSVRGFQAGRQRRQTQRQVTQAVSVLGVLDCLGEDGRCLRGDGRGLLGIALLGRAVDVGLVVHGREMMQHARRSSNAAWPPRIAV